MILQILHQLKFNRTSLAFIVILVFSVSCSDDESPGTTPTLEVADFNTTLEEEPETGDILGTIETTTNQENLTFTLTSTNPSGAVTVDHATGIIIVEDATLFDFEAISEITGTVTISAGDLSKMASISIKLSRLTDYELDVIEYFKEIALGFEFGGATEITRRWESDMKIFVGGSPTAAHLSELDDIIDEINGLTNGFTASIVSDTTQSNYYIYFGSGDDFGKIFPSASSLAESNWGLFFLFWNGSQQLIRGHMYVDIFRANSQEQLHLLREELTQSLGLAKDSDRYSDSIFQQAFSTKTTSYSQIDKDLIRLLYHADMSVGLTASTVDQRLRTILLNE